MRLLASSSLILTQYVLTQRVLTQRVVAGEGQMVIGEGWVVAAKTLETLAALSTHLHVLPVSGCWAEALLAARSGQAKAGEGLDNLHATQCPFQCPSERHLGVAYV